MNFQTSLDKKSGTKPEVSRNTGVVQDLYEDYNNQLSAVNQSAARLENEVHNTAQRIDSAGSLVETEKLKAKLQAVQGTLDTNLQRATLAALKMLVQSESNRNDQARAQEASRQRRTQEMSLEIQQLREMGGKLLGRVCKCSFMDNAPSWR